MCHSSHMIFSLSDEFRSNLGAGCRCQSPSFCPFFVHCPEFVHFLSTSCPHFVLVLSLSHFCLLFVTKIPTSVLKNSSSCPHALVQSHFCPIFAIIFYSDSIKNCWTKTGQKLDRIIFGFTTWSPCTWTKVGQSLDLWRS